jgi:Nucleotidyl transferase AbiEii toxin, Type IV TA system
MNSPTPFLDALCWQIGKDSQLTAAEILQTYERGWRYLGVLADPSEEEWQEIRQLTAQYGSWLQADLILGEKHPMRYQWHDSIVVILDSLKSDLLQSWGVCFGGGTLVSLMCSEHRLSQDIDFLASNGGYRQLRTVLSSAPLGQKYEVLFRPNSQLQFPREMQMDQYGIRFPVVVDGLTIKLEIVAEGRIMLDPPRWLDFLPVPCLSAVDCWAEKLLANAVHGVSPMENRWPDDRIRSRDLIDLAMLRLSSPIPEVATKKATAAYPVLPGLRSAVERFQAQPSWREQCYEALEIGSSVGGASPQENRLPEVVDGVDLLAADLGLAKTVRVQREIADSSAEN